MASDLDQITTNVRKAFWSSQLTPEQKDKLLSALENRAISLSKLVVEIPREYGLVEGKLDCGRHEHEVQTSTETFVTLNEKSGASEDSPSRYIERVSGDNISNERYHVTQQHSNLGGKEEQRRGPLKLKSNLGEDSTDGIHPSSSRELFSGDVDSHFAEIPFSESTTVGEGIDQATLLRGNIDYLSTSESESDYALIEPSNKLEKLDDSSTDDEQDLIPIDLAVTDSPYTQKTYQSEFNSRVPKFTSKDSPETLNDKKTVKSSGYTCKGKVSETTESHSTDTTMSLKEPSVPRIAITPDDDTLDRDIDDMIDGAVNTIDTHTDIEDLDDETDEVNVSKGKRKLSFKLKTGDDGAVTDVEDVEASDGDEDEETEIDLNSPQILAALENILDAEGSYEELFKHDSLSNSGKTVGSTGQHSFQGLGIPEDSRITGILTDVEDFSASEDEGIFKSYVKEVDAEFLTELLENMGTVDIADTVKKENQGVSPALTPSPGASPIHRRSLPESKERASGYEAHGRTSPRSGRKSPTHRSALSPTYSGSIRRFSDVTDTEILDSDSEEEKTKAAVLSRTRRHPPKGKGSLRPPMLGKGSATDVEDVEFTDDEILGAKTKLEKRSNSPSSLVKDYTRKNIKHKDRGQEMAGGKLLGVVYDPDEGHTDLEDMEASGTEDEVAMEHFHYIKDPPENVFSIEEMESMYGSVMESQTTVDTSGGLSASLENQLTDTEDLMEPSPIKFIRNKDDDQSSVSSGCSTEEGSLQGSDSEAKCARKAWREGKTTQLPVTQVKFFERPDGSDPVPVIVSPDPSKGNKKYLLKTKKSPLLVPQATDGGVTDVEELISSGESDSDEYGADNSEKQSGKKSPQQNSDDAATDLEDFEADNLEEIYFSHQLPADLNPEDIPGFPPPVRELTLVKQDEHGHPTVLVLPLDEVKARGLFNPEESGAIPTDVEDLEDSEDDVEDQGAGLRVIDAEGNRTLLVTPDLPPMEGGIVECTDTMKVEKKKLKLPSQAMADPITDTEEMFLDTSPVQRKRKVRSRPQSSHKKPPMPASPVVVTPPPTATIAASTTDIEELEVSDVDSLPPGVKVSPSSMKTMSLNADNSANNSDAKTDIEDVEASDVDERNEIPSDRDACPTPDLMREYGFETITEKQGDGPFSDDVRASVIVQHSQIRVSDTKHQPQKHGSIGSLPTIRMISPSPDIHGTTDTEELFASADEGRESPTPVEIPYEFEDHYSVVHVKHTRKIDIDAPGEAKYLKDHRILDAHTDVEDLGLSEEEGQHNDINVDYAAEAAEELGKHQESVLSGMAVYDGEKKVCVCTGSRDKDSDESLSKVCVCIGKPDGGITIVSEALAASETNAELQSAAASQRKKGSQGQQPADGATEEWAEKMQQKHSAGHGGPATEDAGISPIIPDVALSAMKTTSVQRSVPLDTKTPELGTPAMSSSVTSTTTTTSDALVSDITAPESSKKTSSSPESPALSGVEAAALLTKVSTEQSPKKKDTDKGSSESTTAPTSSMAPQAFPFLSSTSTSADRALVEELTAGGIQAFEVESAFATKHPSSNLDQFETKTEDEVPDLLDDDLNSPEYAKSFIPTTPSKQSESSVKIPEDEPNKIIGEGHKDACSPEDKRARHIHDLKSEFESDTTSQPYVTTPTLQRRSFSRTIAGKIVRGSRPAPLEVVQLSNEDYDGENVTSEQHYTVTEPGDDDDNVDSKTDKWADSTCRVNSSPDLVSLTDPQPLQFIKTVNKDLQNLASFEADLGMGPSGSVEKIPTPQEEKKRPLFRIESSEDEGEILGQYPSKEFDEQLFPLAEPSESVSGIDEKFERRVKKAERRFERIASKSLEEEERASVTGEDEVEETPSARERTREMEFQRMTSQLSTEELAGTEVDFQKVFTELLEEPSEEWDTHSHDLDTPERELDSILPEDDDPKGAVGITCSPPLPPPSEVEKKATESCVEKIFNPLTESFSSPVKPVVIPKIVIEESKDSDQNREEFCDSPSHRSQEFDLSSEDEEDPNFLTTDYIEETESSESESSDEDEINLFEKAGELTSDKLNNQLQSRTTSCDKYSSKPIDTEIDRSEVNLDHSSINLPKRGETGGAEHMTQEDAPATYSTTMRAAAPRRRPPRPIHDISIDDDSDNVECDVREHDWRFDLQTHRAQSQKMGSEFYQTQDPESTSEYDPSQTTTQARVVTTRTLTRTVMGEDGRPVSVTTTETEVSDGGGAEGVLDSNQLRESMQQIIDQFASEEEMKEGKESKEEKKPE
ncbi:uncharacterized protein LOC124160805 isoform X19 [Ischnura elegans]|uniref:uncharacterized protein LOC124160805 isoform X19 n=1 Tax=Ischnura elegans TaxID=197161 RepID=UPI001ED8B5DD|nr:uncharacterized protein LOC124160805 isoform X19 [Ischnura elegans]